MSNELGKDLRSELDTNGSPALNGRYSDYNEAMKLLPLTVVVAVCLLARAQSRNPQAQSSPSQGQPAVYEVPSYSQAGYVGNRVCQQCHHKEASLYNTTAHFRTSQEPNAHSVLGEFTPGLNRVPTGNPSLSYEMTKVGNSYFETSIMRAQPPIRHTERIDIVVGSGRRGQTSLFWQGNQLFELPVTYWTALKSWGNSPGYLDDKPRFDKPILPRCLECHASYFQSVRGTWNAYKKDSLVLGISCETCHGPGREHVAAARQHSADLRILSLHSLSRDRQMDICALCHAGAGAQTTGPALSFRPGDDLAKYITVSAPTSNSGIDVHGKQVEALEASQCWQFSQELTCTTCHDVHRPQHDAQSFSRFCVQCHTLQACGFNSKHTNDIAGRCVDCHMPVQQSEAVFTLTNGKRINPMLRNHRIGVFIPEPDVERGDQAFSSGQYAHAVKEFQQAITAVPDSAMLQFKLALALDKAGDIQGEKSALLKAIVLNPHMAVARSQLGYLLSRDGDVASAEQEFRSVVEASPRYTQAWISLAATLAMQSKTAEAKSAVANALKIDPSNLQALQLQHDLVMQAPHTY